MKDKPVVLIVDDQPQNIELLEAYLMPLKYTLITAASGKEAIQKVSENQIDLVLLDVMMPVMNGYEVCRKIRTDAENHFLPIIMVTALADTDSRIQGLESGADDFLNKPLQRIELIARAKNLLKLKFLRDEVEAKNNLISGMLHRYVDNGVIDHILANPDEYSKLGGHRASVASFFCDIRGFTALAESMDADALIALLNSIYKELTQIVFDNKGTFDKYIGDCIMAFWGAPVSVPDETLWAVRAALEMQKRFKKIQLTWPESLQNIGIGIGINYGEVVVGNIGTEKTMDYTVIGDAVNTAQRVESLAQAGQILITEQTLLRVGKKVIVQQLEPAAFKGKANTVNIYEVRSEVAPDSLL